MNKRLLLAFAFASALPLIASAAEAPPAAVAAKASAALPALADPAADWQRYYDKSEAEGTMDEYNILVQMYGSRGEIDGDCGQYLASLDQAIVHIPVGIGLWRAGEECGQALHDKAIEQRYAVGVDTLASYAIAHAGTGFDSPPIPVITGDDTRAILDATGLDVLYGYGEWRSTSPYLRLTYALWDKEQGVERHLAFDYLDTYFRTAHTPADAGYPTYRKKVRHSMLLSMAKAQEDTSRDLGIADASRAANSKEEQLAMLRPSAAEGGLVSADLWWSVCSHHEDSCADGLVDALLPAAEKGYALARVRLALAYATGVGVKQDLAAATTLLDAAEKRWPGNAYAAFAESLLDNDGVVPDEVLQRLDRGAKQGQRRAMQAWARAQVARLGDKDELPPELLPRMRELGEKGVPAAIAGLWRHYFVTKDMASAREWLRRGAATGDAGLMERYATAQVYGQPGPRDLAGGIETMRAAAMAGNASAMRWMGMLSAQRKQWAEADRWYGSAIDYDNLDAIVPLLQMYEQPHPGVSPTPAELLKKYQAIEKAGYDNAAFRRSYAAYLVNKAQPRDPAKAKALMLRDAIRNDPVSQYLLGLDLLQGKYGEKDEAEGMKWIDLATAKNKELKDALANYLYYTDRSPAARQRAIALERELVAGDSNGARNNLAWWLCTSEDASLRAPAEGLKVALAMGPTDRVEASALDTVAACHAANGDFAKAEEVERVVIERHKLMPMNADADELERRLKLYRARKVYIENKADEPSPES